MTPAKWRTGKRRTWHHGIGADAAALGVCRQYLWYILTGRKQSRSLTRRYADLKASQPNEPGKTPKS
jgi:hypothetical protein